MLDFLIPWAYGRVDTLADGGPPYRDGPLGSTVSSAELPCPAVASLLQETALCEFLSEVGDRYCPQGNGKHPLLEEPAQVC